VGSVSICCSVLRRTRLWALLNTYAVLLGLVACSFCCPLSYALSSPFAFFVQADRWMYGGVPWGGGTLVFAPSLTLPTSDVLVPMTAQYALCHGLVAVVCLAVAVYRLRRLPASPRLAEQGDLEGAGFALVVPRVTASPPFAGDQALLWKELNFGIRPGEDWVRQMLFVLALALLVGTVIPLGVMLSLLGFHIRLDSESLAVLNGMFRGLVICQLGVQCLGMGLQAAGSVARERERRTLDGLLALPVERAEILRAKWRGSLHWGRPFLYTLAILGAVGLVTGVLHPVGAVLLALAGTVHLRFFCTLGLWLSVVSRNVLRATLGLALVLLLVTGVPWLVLTFSQTFGTQPPARPGFLWFQGRPGLTGITMRSGVWDVETTAEPATPWVSRLLAAGVDPPGTWWRLGFSSDPLHLPALEDLLAVAVGLAIYTLTERLLWWGACRALRGEQRHG
jgi:hypothetical protein